MDRPRFSAIAKPLGTVTEAPRRRVVASSGHNRKKTPLPPSQDCGSTEEWRVATRGSRRTRSNRSPRRSQSCITPCAAERGPTCAKARLYLSNLAQTAMKRRGYTGGAQHKGPGTPTLNPMPAWCENSAPQPVSTPSAAPLVHPKATKSVAKNHDQEDKVCEIMGETSDFEVKHASTTQSSSWPTTLPVEENCTGLTEVQRRPSVSFNMERCMHEVTPYSEIYGMHPRLFVLDKFSRMLPAPLRPSIRGRSEESFVFNYAMSDSDSDPD